MAGEDTEELEALRRALAARTAEVGSLRKLAQERQRELDQLRSHLLHVLGQLRAQLELVETSAAWRYGHAASRAVGRVRGRQAVTGGAVTRALATVERALALVGAETGDGVDEQARPGGEQAQAAGSEQAQAAGGEQARADAGDARPASAEERILLGQDLRTRLGPSPESDRRFPALSAVLASDAPDRARRALAHLRATGYPRLQVILVDNDSADGAVSALSGEENGIPVTSHRFEDRCPVAVALGRGVGLATGELVLLLDDGMVPAETGWLEELVASVLAHPGALVGARVARPEITPDGRWPLEQGWLAIESHRGAPVAVPERAGDALEGRGFGTETPVAAVTGGCLLAAADTLASLGGLDSGYRSGLWDVDLCVRARERGHEVVASGRALLVDDRAPGERVSATLASLAGRRRLAHVHGAWLRRARIRGRLEGDAVWGRLEAVAVPEVGEELALALTTMGWQVDASGADATLGGDHDPDVVIVAEAAWDAGAIPPSTVAVAWVTGDAEDWHERPWLERYDILLAGAAQAPRLEELTARPVDRLPDAPTGEDPTSDRQTARLRARALRRLVAAQNERLSFCLKICAPDWEQAERWGDLHFARGLGQALRRLGHAWRIDVESEWSQPASATFDVAVHLRGRSEYAPVPGQFNVLWLISHPETFTPQTASGYDLVCVASEPFAERLRDRVAVPVRALEQATDPRRFFPDPDPALGHEVAFVGNSRGTRRKVLDDLLPSSLDIAVWGQGWQGTPAEPHLQGEWVPNEELRRVYSSCAIVLCDHWGDMRARGFRSNRIYDALACGALVVSDRVANLDGAFGDAVVTYEDPAGLEPLLRALLADPEGRARRTAGARERILAGETFDDRARTLVEWVQELRRER